MENPMLLRPMMILMLLVSVAFQLNAADDKNEIDVRVERIEELRSKVAQGTSEIAGSSSLMLHVLLKGDLIAGAVRMGELTFKAKDDLGNDLKMRSNWIDEKEFRSVDRSGRGLEDALASETIRVELMMDAPLRKAAKLATVEGSIKLLVGSPVDVVIDMPGEKVNKEIEDASLKAAGVKVMLMSFNPKGGAGLGVYARFRIIGKEWAITSLAVLDEKGKVLSKGSGGGSGVGIVPSITYEIYGEDPLPEGAKLRLTVLKDVKAVAVPIALKDVELP